MSEQGPENKRLSPEELKKKLEEAGFKSGSWQGPPKPEGGDVNLSHLTCFADQAKLLEKLIPLLEAQVTYNQKQADDLREKVERLKHGGGA